jgi:mannose-1-phosphate guanylyltransferase
MEHYYALIMAGGGGTRLWPMSRSSMPKQLLPLVEDRSMFRISVERLAPLFTPDRIYIVTGAKYVDMMNADTPEIPAQNFIVEPYGRDSGPAAALGITVIHRRDPQAAVAILTADHHISQKEGFRDALAAAYDVAQQGYIVTLGISPTFPSTGFGYIHQGDVLCQMRSHTAYHSLGFKEKPDAVRAAAFLASGDYSWNSGMFIWTVAQALAEYQRQQPDMYEQFMTLAATVDTSEFNTTLNTIWDKVKKISIDYAVMEGAQNLAVIPVSIGWNDIGSWSSLFEVLPLDPSGNAFKSSSSRSDQICMDTSNTLVFSDKLVVTVGIDNLVVVETPDAILICHKDRAQEVKEVVNQLRATNRDRYL